MPLISPLRLRMLQLIIERPGVSQGEIAQALYGRSYHQSVGAECRHLAARRLVLVTGRGSAQDPLRYTANADFRCADLDAEEVVRPVRLA
jgi:hypothetical protein